jgi:hypothetical protein
MLSVHQSSHTLSILAGATVWQKLAAVCPPNRVPTDRPYQLFVFGCCLDAGTCNSTGPIDSCSKDFVSRFGAKWAMDCSSFKLGVPPTLLSDWQWNRFSNKWFRAGTATAAHGVAFCTLLLKMCELDADLQLDSLVQLQLFVQVDAIAGLGNALIL